MIADGGRQPSTITVVIPNWNGLRWLPACLGAVAAQTEPAQETLIVDNGSGDGSLAYLREHHPQVRVLELATNTGFAHAVNVGLAAARGEMVALINTDVILAPEWLARMSSVLAADDGLASVACKMLHSVDPPLIYDAGDILRRDGACEQRGRFGRDIGQYDAPQEIFGACAGAALYRRAALRAVGGFDERYFAYLEDVDLALRLRLEGWGCRYEPVVAWHHGQASSAALPGGHHRLVERNSLLLVAKFFPARWLPLVAYRQASWLVAAIREGYLGAHLAGLRSGVGLALRLAGERRALRRAYGSRIGAVIAPRPIRGPAAGGHPHERAATFRAADFQDEPT